MLFFMTFAIIALPTTILRPVAAMSSSPLKSHVVPTLHTAYPYTPPAWTNNVLVNTPRNGRLRLAHLPTPLHRLDMRIFKELNMKLLIKRDDVTGGLEMGGNKIRKLEFLLADAVAQGCNAVVTIGGEQSNHCRATASACRVLGTLDPHLILRTKKKAPDIGLVGNVLVDRMMGAQIHLCTPSEYARIGSNALIDRLCQHLESKDAKVYPIPVGGSNGLGSWGYIEAVDEVDKQLQAYNVKLNHVVFACGSGGTATGITLGMALAHGAGTSTTSHVPQIHAVCVCDDPEYFYKTVADIADEIGLVLPTTTTEEFVRSYLTVHQGKGLGYASSTKEELDFITNFALETGIVLDPVYSGKALYHFLTYTVNENPEAFRDKTILFWHTGGALGLYDKADELLDKLQEVSPIRKLDVHGKSGENTTSV